MSTDELFASLGGSLMKDLWADLQGGADDDDIGFSLEQLERELAFLDDGNDAGSTPLPRASAASLVVSHQGAATVAPPPAMMATTNNDAWQASLEKFTSMGTLEQDFLAADSAKKQTLVSQRPPGFLATAEDYDVTEKKQAPMLAPPGMHRPPAASMLEEQPPLPRVSTRTPDNSMSELPFPEAPTPGQQVPLSKATAQPAPTPQNSMSAIPKQLPATQQHQPPTGTVPNAWSKSQSGPPMMPPGGMPMMHPPAMGMPFPPQGMPPQGMPPQGMPPMGIPVPQMMKQGTPWQSPPQPQHVIPPQARFYCQVHPNAPPIPATALESSMMKSRDLSYIIHSMLKPILLAGTNPSDYDLRLLRRAQGRGVNTDNKKGKKGNKKGPRELLDKEMVSRREKTEQWTKDENVLGNVAKTDVTRPRALLATTSSPVLAASKKDDEQSQKQRASLWRARLYIDEGYKACDALVQIWQTHGSTNTVPPQIQPHLKRLFKVLGMKSAQNDKGEGDGVTYSMDPTKTNALECIVKLSKGRTFLVRLLEKALLPPKAVQVLIPSIMEHALASGIRTNSSEGGIATDVTDSRLFTCLGQLLSTLPNLSPSCILTCVEKATKAASKEAWLASQSRMGCIHALLRRGNAEAGSNPEFAQQWKEVENTFMKMLE